MIYPSALLTAWFSAHFILRRGMISAQTKDRIKLLGDKQKKTNKKKKDSQISASDRRTVWFVSVSVCSRRLAFSYRSSLSRDCVLFSQANYLIKTRSSTGTFVFLKILAKIRKLFKVKRSFSRILWSTRFSCIHYLMDE